MNLECNPEIPVATGEEHGVSRHKSRWGLFPLQWLVMNPEVPITTRNETWLPWGNTSRTLKSTLQLERNPKLHAKPQGKPWDSPLNARWGPFPLQHLKRNPTFPLKTWNSTQHPLGNSRSYPTYPSSLERNTQFPRTPQSEPLCPASSGDEGQFPCFVWKGIPMFPLHLKRRLVSHWNSTGTLVGHSTMPKTPVSISTRDKA